MLILVLELLLAIMMVKKNIRSIIEDNVFVGSNSSLIAPIKNRPKNSTIGAGSVITKNIPPNQLAIGAI